MKLSKNPKFLQHKLQIEKALDRVDEFAQSSGRKIYNSMLISAEQLDLLLDPRDGGRPNSASVSIKRDEFHKTCRDMGEWLLTNTPDVKLSWD